MKKVSRMLFCVIVLSFMISCAFNKEIICVVTNDYLGKSLEGERLLVRSFLNEAVYKHGDEKPYKDVSELDLLNALSESVKLYSTFDNVFVENIDTSLFEKKTLELPDNKQIEISAPTTSLKIDNSDYILFIEDYYVYYLHNESAKITYKYHNMKYMVWDNNNSCILSYGVLDFAAYKFDKTITKLIKLIFENSPFQLMTIDETQVEKT